MMCEMGWWCDCVANASASAVLDACVWCMRCVCVCACLCDSGCVLVRGMSSLCVCVLVLVLVCVCGGCWWFGVCVC